MKVRELVELLEGYEPESEVVIQHGGEFDYMAARLVSTQRLDVWNGEDLDEPKVVVAIEYS